MSETTKKISQLSRRALIAPQSFNEETREFECIYSTDTPVLLNKWEGAFYEVLSQKGQRLERFQNGIPFLNNHRQGGNVGESVLGICSNPIIENSRSICKVKISDREDLQSIRQDIKDGILRNISCGYRVYSYEEKPRAEGETIPTYIATDWEVMENSLVSIPADANAQIRSELTEENEVIINKSDTKMADENKKPEDKKVVASPESIQNERAQIQTPNTEKIVQKAIEAERQRCLEIRSAVSKARLGIEIAETLISEGKTVDQSRAQILEEWAKKDPTPAPTVKSVADGEDKMRAAMIDGLLSRAGQTPENPAPGFEDFRGKSLLRMAETHLVSRGVNPSQMTNRQIVTQSMQSRGLHSVSDFPIILGDTINRTLRSAYEYQERTFTEFCSREDHPDFRGVTRAQISGLIGDFDEVLEGGEYKAGSMADAGETYKVAKFGRTIGLPFEALINDDLSAFTRIPRAIAAKAAQKQSDLVYAILTENPNMADGNALFSVAHLNLAAAGGAITVATLGAARASMRKQKGLNGDFINVQATYLIVGPDKETEAQQVINATIVATKTADTNIFRGSLQIIVDPRIIGNQWFLSSTPMAVDTIEFGFLQGEPELFTEQNVGFEVDSLIVKARMVFAAKAIDHRGLYKNPGN
jgi:hypothetical protein